MKKIFLICALSLFALRISAQNVVATMTGSGDQIADSGTDYVIQKVEGTYESVSVQAKIVKDSGVVTNSYAKIYGSVDGTNFVIISTDTLACSSATTNTFMWTFTNSNFLWYKIIFTASDSVHAKIYGYLMGNPSTNKHAVSNMLSNYGVAGDTIVNSGSGYVQLRVNGWYDSMSLQVVATKISGTAGGTVTLQVSNDGTNYVAYTTATYPQDQTSTMTVLNQTTTTQIFVIAGSPYAYYRLNYVGTGTMSVRLRGYLLPSKK